MLNISKEKILIGYEKASKTIQTIFNEQWLPENIQIISKKMSIRLDKEEVLLNLIGMVILNLIPLSRFLEVVESEIGVDKEKATLIVQEVDEHIFKRIRDIVKAEGVEKKEASTSSDKSVVKTNKVKNVDPYREMF